MRGFLLIFLSILAGTCLGAGLYTFYYKEITKPEIVYITVPSNENPKPAPTKIETTPTPTTFPNSNEDLQESIAFLETRIRQMESIIAETNRELSELRFRVDTHSQSFRPFQEITPNPGTPLLPFSPED